VTAPDRELPLQGVVVISLEQAIAAPFASRQLADLGATVIKVEPARGDLARHYDSVMSGQSVNFVWANRGKQSLVLDLKTEREKLETLIAGADVFLHNLAPDAARRAGVEPAALVDRHPHLVACAISGYGPGGPRSDDKAYDLAVQAEAGAFSVTGNEEMSKVGFPAADISAGMYALTGILAALVRRERTGDGGVVEVSMLDGLAEWMSAPLYGAVYGGGQAPRTGRRHHLLAPYGTFVLADGSNVLIAVQTDADWQVLARDVLGDSELAADPRFTTNPDRTAHVGALEEQIVEALARIDADEVRRRLVNHRIAYAAVNDLEDVWNHEQLRARGRFVESATPTGPVEVLASAMNIDGRVTGSGEVPALNEHDAETVASILRSGSIALGEVDAGEHDEGSEDLHG
jgi:itaconate CoA-transferase